MIRALVDVLLVWLGARTTMDSRVLFCVEVGAQVRVGLRQVLTL